MTEAEARKLMNWDTPAVITIERVGVAWTGRVVGVVAAPCLILEREDGGQRMAIRLDGAAVAPREQQQTEETP